MLKEDKKLASKLHQIVITVVTHISAHNFSPFATTTALKKSLRIMHRKSRSNFSVR